MRNAKKSDAVLLERFRNGDFNYVILSLETKFKENKCTDNELIIYGSSIFKAKKDAKNAIKIFESIKDKNISSDIYGNIAFLRHELGELEHSRILFESLIKKKNVANNNIYFNAAENLKYLGENECALKFYKKSIAKSFNKIQEISWQDRVTALMRMLVLNYINSNIEECIKIFKILSEPRMRVEAVSTNAAYISLLARLVKHDLNSNDLAHEYMEKIYAIGESHAICMHNIKVKKEKSQIKTLWVEGLKSYHLQIDSENKYKSSFEFQISKLPANSKIIVVAGEIDCRYDGGIIQAARKKGDNPTRLAKDTAFKFIRYLNEIRDKYKISISVWGIPPLYSHGENHQINIVNDIIEEFTTESKKNCENYKIAYYDVFNYLKFHGSLESLYDRRHINKGVIEKIFSII